MIRIASGQAFWGDWPQAPALQVRSGPIDYLVLDYLAEVTVAILDKVRRRQPDAGYAADFIDDIGPLLPEIIDKDVRVIASAGGVNPHACAEALVAKANDLGLRGLRVAVVAGDDVTEAVRPGGGLHAAVGGGGDHEAIDGIAARITSAHVYLGVQPILEALDRDAQIVITGRVTDTALTLAPIVHHFDTSLDDWNALAFGTVVGHILECGGQASGGNFLGDWRAVPRLESLGFPIAEIHSPDTAVITKHEALGGLVNLATVKEQLVYEIGDPRAYLSPDCTSDFTTIQLSDEGTNRVGLRGVEGGPPPETLKLSCVHDAGWKVSGQLTYSWPEADAKARAAGELLRRRVQQRHGDVFDEWRVEIIGAGACHGTLARSGRDAAVRDLPEVVLRVSARASERRPCDEVGRELMGLILTGPPGATGYAGPRPRASQTRAIWSGTLPRDAVQPTVEVLTT